MSTFATTHTRRDRFADWAVILLVVIALIAGWLVKSSAENATMSISSSVGSLTYPTSWISNTENGLLVQDTRTASGVPTSFGITSEALDADQGLDALSTRQTLGRAQELGGFAMLNTTKQQVGSDSAGALSCAYGGVPDVGTVASAGLPVVVEASDTLIKRGTTLYVLTFSSDSASFASLAGLRASLLNTVKLP